jgi:small-conductance mechanosensitive channel
MTTIILTILITACLIFIAGGIALSVFVDWLENNEL